MANVISMEGIGKEYRLASGVTTVLKSIELFIDAGEFVSIMGPSGSGKTTLMNLIGTLDRPTRGVYFLDDEDITAFDDVAMARIRNQTLGFVFQGFNLLPRRSVIDNIALPLLYGGEERKTALKRAEFYLEQVGLSTHRNYFPIQLSGGQQQRIAIARALAGEPKLILADEPTGNLDSHTGKEIMELFRDLSNDGITIVIVTHDMAIATCARRLIQLKDGEIVYDGPMR